MTSAAEPPLNIADYDISATRGFLPDEDPLVRLPQAFDAWEEMALGLPKLLMTGRIRGLIEKLPPFPVESLTTEREWRRAMGVLSYIGHAYVWGEPKVPAKVPAVLAMPWKAVADHLGRPPILSYASYALDNWYRVDSNGPIECGNICLIQNFLGGMDEEWFILIHIDIEQRAAQAITAIPRAQVAARNGDLSALKKELANVDEAMSKMYGVMERMPEHCDPYVYFHRVRPYIHGWKNHPEMPEGLVYEGCYDGAPQAFRGETGAQSSIVPCLDGLLGVEHADDPLKEYLMEMRTYMPPKHRAFLEAVEKAGSVRNVVEQSHDSELQAVYNRCLEWVEKFRSIHLEFAAKYIYSQLQTDANNPSKVGTGGTPFMKYLKKHRDETTEHVLTPQ